jgi:hypothetical protein
MTRRPMMLASGLLLHNVMYSRSRNLEVFGYNIHLGFKLAYEGEITLGFDF